MAYRGKERPWDDRGIRNRSYVYAPDAVHLLAQQHVTPEHQPSPVLLGDSAHVPLKENQVAFCIGLQICVLVNFGKSHAPANLHMARNLLELVALLTSASLVLEYRHRLDKIGDGYLLARYSDVDRCS